MKENCIPALEKSDQIPLVAKWAWLHENVGTRVQQEQKNNPSEWARQQACAANHLNHGSNPGPSLLTKLAEGAAVYELASKVQVSRRGFLGAMYVMSRMTRENAIQEDMRTRAQMAEGMAYALLTQVREIFGEYYAGLIAHAVYHTSKRTMNPLVPEILGETLDHRYERALHMFERLARSMLCLGAAKYLNEVMNESGFTFTWARIEAFIAEIVGTPHQPLDRFKVLFEQAPLADKLWPRNPDWTQWPVNKDFYDNNGEYPPLEYCWRAVALVDTDILTNPEGRTTTNCGVLPNGGELILAKRIKGFWETTPHHTLDATLKRGFSIDRTFFIPATVGLEETYPPNIYAVVP